MIDEQGARLWAEHHLAFGDWLDRAAATVRAGISRFAGWDGSTHQLIALAAAFVLTALNIGFSSSAA